MHLAEGLEFRAVAAMACDDEVLPLQERIETVADDSDLAETYETERNLLYVACTRARPPSRIQRRHAVRVPGRSASTGTELFSRVNALRESLGRRYEHTVSTMVPGRT